MITNPKIKKEYYQAMLDKNSTYDGIFFAGITSTGIFCHATCPARKPKFENCEFYQTAEEALLSGFRPCKRCQPLSHPRENTPVIQEMLNLVEKDPEKRWKDADFNALGTNAVKARRQFKQKYGMTFVQYARARRMGLALQSIKAGEKIIDAQLDTGYDSASGFHDAFSKIMGSSPNQTKSVKTLYASWLDTRLGPMLIIADEMVLYLLEFVDRRGLEREIERLRLRLNASIVPGELAPHKQIKEELIQYFAGELSTFQTPFKLLGSDFQREVWQALQTIPMGQTSTYKLIAEKIARPLAIRAVGNANGLNQLAIIIPCHRVIQTNGSLGGYGGGVERKRWLLEHEEKIASKRTTDRQETD